MRDPIQLNMEELEERIAPDSVNGVPGESNGNSGRKVSNRHRPQPGSHTADSHGNCPPSSVPQPHWNPVTQVPALDSLPHLTPTGARFGRNQVLARVHEPSGAGRSIRLDVVSRQHNNPS